MCKEEKYKYRKEKPSIIYRFDIVFFNILSFEYPDLASAVEDFLVPELETNFYEDIRDGNRLRGDAYLWLYNMRYDAHNHILDDFETGIFFWDNDIYQKAIKMIDGKEVRKHVGRAG